MELIARIRACELCKAQLPDAPRPILQVDPAAKILIAGQAPGSVTREKGIPFDDASGDRLRAWMGIERSVFYDASKIAVVPMAFCFPGSGESGDLPPPPLCATTWRKLLLDSLPKVELTLVIGQYAMDWHLGQDKRGVTAAVMDWRTSYPHIIPLPHPSPRNNRWLKRNPWFAGEVLPALQEVVASLV